MGHYKAGLMLESAVSRALTDIGIAHRRTQHLGKEDVLDRVDMVVPASNGRPTIEIQLTLRAKERTKIFAFALRALTTRVRGVRIYLEVVGTRRKDDIAGIATNVARAIQTIVRRFRDFGEHRLLGVRVNARNAAIEKFDLVSLCGSRLLEAAQRFWEHVEEARRISRERMQRDRDVFAHLAQRLLNWRAYHPPRLAQPSFRADTRALYVPRRHCA